MIKAIQLKSVKKAQTLQAGKIQSSYTNSELKKEHCKNEMHCDISVVVV